MAPKLSEDEIDDLIYFARTGENDDLKETVAALAEREGVTPAEILIAAKDEGNKSTTLHMATGNGHLGMCAVTTLYRYHELTIFAQRPYGYWSSTSKTGQRTRGRPSSTT